MATTATSRNRFRAAIFAGLFLAVGAHRLLAASGSGFTTKQIRTDAPVAVGSTNQEGTSLAVARADHVHALPANLTANPSAQTSASGAEVLCALTSTAISVPANTRVFSLANNGANPIWVNPAGAAVVNVSRPVAVGTSWTFKGNATALANLHCITTTSPQVTGKGTWTDGLQ